MKEEGMEGVVKIAMGMDGILTLWKSWTRLSRILWFITPF
jgi:hypothetical protein